MKCVQIKPKLHGNTHDYLDLRQNYILHSKSLVFLIYSIKNNFKSNYTTITKRQLVCFRIDTTYSMNLYGVYASEISVSKTEIRLSEILENSSNVMKSFAQAFSMGSLQKRLSISGFIRTYDSSCEFLRFLELRIHC